LKDVKRSPLGELESVVMSVRMQGLTAHRQIAAHYGTGHEELSSFFNDLAEHWSGWQGIKSYRSLERDLQLEATHTGSHVNLTFDLRDPKFPGTPETWRVCGQLTLKPGQELIQISEALREFMGGTRQCPVGGFVDSFVQSRLYRSWDETAAPSLTGFSRP
jgi:hypothetical protein